MTRLDKYVKYLGWFLLGNLLLVAIYAGLGVSGYLPPPPFAKSISFDEKVVWLRHHAQSRIDLLALGSSMTLSDLDSEALVAHRQGRNFVNASSWGLKIRHINKFLRLLDGIYEIKSLLICVSPVDFRADERGDEVPHRQLVDRYLRGGSQPLAQILLFSGDYFVGNLKKMDFYRHRNNHYQSLLYDRYGGVSFVADGFAIDENRWQGKFLEQAAPDERNFQALVELAGYCRERGIGLCLWTTPARQQVVDRFAKDLFAAHLLRLRKLAESQRFDLFEANNDAFDDSMFVDWGHLNEKGAKLYTTSMLQLMAANHRQLF